MAIKRVQDLPKLENVLDTDLFEMSYKLNSENNLLGYVSKNFSVMDLIQALSGFTEATVRTDVYSYQSYPVGTVLYSAKNLLSNDFLSGDILPADGTEVFYDSQISANQLIYDTSAMTRIVQVRRNDIVDMFSVFGTMCSRVNGAYFVNEDINLGVINSYQEYQGSEYVKREYDGYFIYDPNNKWARLPKLHNLYIRATTDKKENNTFVSSSCPNIRGQFVNGINTYDMVDRKHLYKYYTGAFSIAAVDNATYYKYDTAIADAIYQKSITKSTKDMDLYSMNPSNNGNFSVYNGKDDSIILDSICLRPYVVISRNYRQITQIN